MRPPLPDPGPTAHLPDPVRLEHDGVVVCDKPPGLPTTGRDLSDPRCLQGLLMARRRRHKVWAAHQLDQDTSGLVLFVLRKPLVAQAGAWLAGGTKAYLAVVHGRLEAPAAVDAPLGFRREGRKRFPALDPVGRPARSRVTPLSVGAAHSLVRVEIETGRTHQARLHLAHLGHPLVGEGLHRAPPCAAHPRHALHAWRLSLPDAPPALRSLEAPLPDDLADLCARLGLQAPE